METADCASRVSVPVRKSLRAFKQTPEYRALLTSVIERRETAAMTATERRRLRLDRVLAHMELDRLRRGEQLSEFEGVLALRDPLHGLLPEGVYE